LFDAPGIDSIPNAFESHCDCGCQSGLPSENLPALNIRHEQKNEKFGLATELWSVSSFRPLQNNLSSLIEPAPPGLVVLSSIERCARICRWLI
jgi:hypothetical protein